MANWRARLGWRLLTCGQDGQKAAGKGVGQMGRPDAAYPLVVTLDPSLHATSLSLSLSAVIPAAFSGSDIELSARSRHASNEKLSRRHYIQEKWNEFTNQASCQGGSQNVHRLDSLLHTLPKAVVHPLTSLFMAF